MTNQEIKTVGQTIAQETQIGGNTAARVGGVVEGIGVALDNKDAANGYYQATINGGTITVNAPNYLLGSGGNLRIKMPSAGTTASTLTIGNANAVQLWYNGAAVSAQNTWEADEIISVFYNGTRFMASNSQGGEKFSTGEKVKETGITPFIESGDKLITSGAINSEVYDIPNICKWINGSISSTTYDYLYSNTRIVSCVGINRIAPIKFTAQNGYVFLVFEYSGVFKIATDINPATYLNKPLSDWTEGTVTITPTQNTKMIAVVVAKKPAFSNLPIAISDSINIQIEYLEHITLREMRETVMENDADINRILITEENRHPIWFQGTLSNEHTWNNSGVNALQRIISTIPSPKKLRVVIQEGYSCSIHEYSHLFDKASDITDGSSWLANSHPWFTGTLDIEPLQTSKTMALILSKGVSRDQDETPLDGVNISISTVSAITDKVNENSANIDNINDVLYGDSDSTEVVLEMEQGGLSAAAGAELENTKRIRSVGFICVHGQFTINVTNGVYFNVMYYKHNNTGSFVKYIGSWIQGGTMTDTWDGCIRISVKKSNEAVIVPTDTSVSIIGKTKDGIIDMVSELIHENSDSYVWGTDMIRRKVDVKMVGALQYLQSFCIYDGKYYSTNGSNIAEQDSSFTILRDTTINLGHGNNLQLVGNGKAWSSGWNDQKMYRVDLSTLTVDETITLPTTGWTTGVVDEDNGIVYIFQRDTPTSTIDQYTFIKYDYVNEEILMTRKIERFAALQSMDLYEGKILMLNGYGTLAAPSGMRIYNTSGDVLTTFDLEVLRSTEPEGIMFERDTHQIYVSDVDKNLYVLS